MNPELRQEALAELARRVKYGAMYRFKPYPWQMRFYAEGFHHRQAMLMAANQVGKTKAAAYETAVHATGKYPSWWKGYVIDTKTPLIWVSSLTNEVSRDIVQKELLGDVGAWGTGLIPHDDIIDIKTRQAGISDVVDTITVRNCRGGVTTIKTKVAAQGWKHYQGTKVHFIWQDEEPDDFRVFTESLTRTTNTNGRIVVTFTPLSGPTQLVQHFVEKAKSDPETVGITTATWDDAPHMSEAKKAELRSTFPAHELDARTRGIPMMGEGAVFPIPDNQLYCEPFPIPAHFHRIAGVDFGVNHPAAGAWLALDVDTDIVYLYDAYRQAKELPAYHASAIKSRDPRNLIPVAWPHDGINEEKSSGMQIKDQYAAEGVNMLMDSARYTDEVGGRQAIEPIVQEMYTRMVEGRFKVFKTPGPELFMEEKRGLHRKNNKINAIRDDVFKATSYAMMMLRWAAPMYYGVGSGSSGRQPVVKSSTAPQ